MKRCIGMIVIAMSLLLINLSFSGKAFAEEIGFSVEAKLPENQKDKSKTYFDLDVSPGEVETLDIQLKNNTEEKITVLAQANTAITNDNGVIDYSANKPDLDETMRYPLSKMVEIEPEITLEPKETKIVKAKVTLPKESFDGIILGGFHFSQKETDEETKQEAGVQIKNKFAYVIGLRLSENDDPVLPDLKLLEVGPGQRNYRNVVLATLQNPMPRTLGNLKVTADVFSTNNLEKPLYHSTQDQLNMAPNSHFSYGIKMNNKAFKVGNYLLKMTAEAAGETWQFEKEFEIKKQEADKFNAEAVELAEEEPNKWVPILITVLVIMVVFVIAVGIWLLVRKNITDKQAKTTAKRINKSNASKKRRRKEE